MSVQLDKSVSPPLERAERFDLRWPFALLAAAGLAFLLPIPGSPVALAGFIGLVGVLILFARSWLIAMLPVLAALGPYFLPLAAAGVNVFGFRLLIILLALFSTPLTNRSGWWFNPVARRTAMFILLWLLYGSLSLFWTPFIGGGLTDVMALIFALGLLLTLFSLQAHKPEHLDKLRIGWVIALAVSAGSAFLEITRGYGLPADLTNEIVVSDVALGRAGSDAAVRSILGFSNQFGGFLLMVLPFVLWSIERARGLLKLLQLGLLALIGILLLYSASRLSLIGFVVQLLVYGLVLQRRWYMPLVVLAGGLVALVATANLISDSNLMIGEKLEKAETGPDRSMNHRVGLTLNGLWMMYQTAGRGVGAGGFEKTIAGAVPFELPITGRIKEWNPHNLWIEVLSEYGIVVFAAFMALLGWIGLLGWRAQRHGSGLDREAATIGRAIIIGLIGYLFCGVASGTILLKPTHWMFFVSLAIMAAALYERFQARHRRDRPAAAPAGALGAAAMSSRPTRPGGGSRAAP